MKFPPVRVFVSFFLLWLPSSVLFAQPQISVALVLDESGSINSANFALEQEGFRRAVTQLPADGSIEISVVYFSTGVNVRLSPTPLTAPNLGTIIAALSKSQSPGGTNMSAAINTAAQVLGGSSASTRILCLSTDGQPNSPSATISAASAARAAGILLDPVGIGLSGSGAALLNSIASHPPVANPGNFTEFGTVIVNKIGAGVGGALNILLSPDPLDFGVFNPNSLADCAKEKSLTIQNRGDTAATVLNIAVVGEDASAFQLVGIGPDLPIVTPFPLPPRFSTSLTVQFSAASAPPDDSFDARVELTAENDAGQVEVFSADLVASLDDDAAACLSLDVTDSYPLLTRISPSGATFTEDGALTEQAVFERLDSLFGFSLRRDRRQGFVADGNARLFLRALTNETSGTIRFQLTGAATSGALLYPLNRTTNQDSDGRIILDVAVSEMEPNIGQATAILRAPEDFPGADSEPESLFEVTACLLETGGCSPIEVRQTLRVRRTPVVLIHGLWSDGRAWSLDPSGKPGMKPGLEAGHFATGLFSYPGSSGPSVVMRPNSPMLPLMIDALCRTQRRADLACSRADIVAHSMGGLVARKFVHDNERYLSDWNFEQGAIRRIHTLGTPYNGSPLANLLLRDNAAVNNCLVDTDPDEDGIQNFNLTLAIAGLTVYGNSVDTAIRDLQVGSPLLETLRDPARKAPTGIQYGNAGEQFDPSLAPLLGLLRDAGCDYDEIFGEESDGIAGLSSLLARNFPAQQSVGLFHTEMTHNATTIQTTLQRLNGPRLGNFASQLTFPAPQPNSPSQNLASSAPVFKAAPPPVKVSLSLTVNDPTPSPGTVVTFQVAGAGPGVSELTLRSEDGSFLETDTSAPFSWQISVPDEASGSLEFQALGVDDDAIVLSNPVVVTVVPDLTAIRQVDFQPNGPLTLFSGTSEQLSVSALFNDGLRRDVTEAVLGTTYTERIVTGLQVTDGDSPSIEVDDDGLLTARQPGVADIAATNNGQTNVRRVTVVAVDENDADGDGLSDDRELALGLDRFNADSDGDGSEDGAEIGSDPDHPLDADGDGVVDALDASIRGLRTSTGATVSMRASHGTICQLSQLGPEDLPPLPEDLAEHDLPEGIFNFTLCDLNPAQSVEVTLYFETPSDQRTAFLAYGPAVPDASPSWFQFADTTATASTIVLSLNDNGSGDSNPLLDTLWFTGGPTTGETFVDIASIPTLSQWSLGLLTLLLLGLGWWALRRMG